MMEIHKNGLRKVFGYGALLILLYWALQNIERFWLLVSSLLGIFTPFLLGLIFAFIVNVPMAQLERLLFKKASPRLKPFSRILSLVLTLLLILGFIFVVLFLVVPELGSSVTVLGNSIPAYIDRFSQWAQGLSVQFPDLANNLAELTLDWGSMLEQAMSVIQNSVSTLLSSTVNVVGSIFSGLLSFFLAAIFAIYVLLQKEQLYTQITQVLRAFVSQKKADRFMYVASLTNRTFTSFLSGQCLEAVILGLLFFVTLSIFQLPYALMISVLTGVTALIPVFGAFIGCAVGTFVILMVSPIQALWFLGIFIVIQQLEGNLIYPRVVGGSIGLPAIWVLLAVTVGGSAMGIAGMLFFIPLCSVLYTLLWEAVDKRKAAMAQNAQMQETQEEAPLPKTEEV